MTPGRTDGSTRDGRGGTPGEGDSSGSLPWRRISRRVLPAYARRHLGVRVAAGLLLVAAVLCTASVLAYTQVQGAAQAEAREELESTAELRAAAVDKWVDSLRSQTAMVAAATPGDQQADDATIDAYLSSVLERGSDSVAAIHYLEDGSVRASTRADVEGRDVSSIEAPWVDLALPGPVAVTERSYLDGGVPALGFVGNADAGGRIVVVGRIPRRLFAGSNRDVETALLTREGRHVAGADGIAGLPDGTLGDGRTVLEGGRLRSYVPVDGTGWLIVSRAPVSSLTGVGGALGGGLLVVVLSGIVALGVVGYAVSRETVSALEQLRRKTGEIEAGNLDVDLATSRTDEIGDLYRAFASMRDALRQQVQQARAAKHDAESSRKEMERQNRRLDQFASTLSHDLRNPLAVARGHVELLNTKLDDDREDLRDHVAKIDDAHDRIDSIIDDVLTLTRKGESVEETERFDLEGVAEEAWSNIDSKDASLEVEASIAIEGDRSRLLRAFENLFRNAIDHVGPGVTVTVGLTRDGFYVEDDGPGIPDEEIDTIFEYGHTTSDDGTGLGLSIVKTIAEAHGWSLWVDGTSGRGARFVFSDVFDSDERVFEESAFTWEHARTDDD